VALKEIRPDKAGSAEVRRRFLNEAAITGLLEHPGIVPIYALDQDAEGQPYYVMRFIQGQTFREAIQAYHAQPTSVRFRELLQRFITVCQTMAYAHSKEVIHRDLKPSNIMLGEFGETLVLDWGLAKQKRSSPEGSDDIPAETPPVEPSNGRESLTQLGQVIGTLAYMSPEQAKGEKRLHPTLDIFALGAILYELLTGRTPYADVPQTTLLYHVQLGRFPTPRQVKKDVSRTLDAICRQAMAVNPAERYGSAQELARDVENWLADEPVPVLPESWPARLGRWARRHRTATATIMALLLTAVVALGVGTILLEQANEETLRQRNAAVAAKEETERARIAAEEAKQKALANAVEAKRSADDAAAVMRFLVQDMIQLALPGAKGKELTVREALDTVSPRLSRTFARAPRIEATLRLALGHSYAVLGRYADADTHFQRAYQLRERHLGAEHPATLEALSALGYGRALLGKIEESLRVRQQVLAQRERLLGPQDPATARSLAEVGMTLLDLNRSKEAEPFLRRAVELYRQFELSQGRISINGLMALEGLGAVLVRLGQPQEGLGLLEQAVEGVQQYCGEEHLETLRAQNSWISGLRRASRYFEAEKKARELLPQARLHHGEDHPRVLQMETQLVVALMQQFKWTEAEPLSALLLERCRRVLPPNHKDRNSAFANRATILFALGRVAEARQVALEGTKDRQTPTPTTPSKPARKHPAGGKP
jgi:tetratricopeptide (TPR) repeat protein